MIAHLLTIAAQALAIQAAPPRPINPRSWVQAEDYPLEAAKYGLAGKVKIRLTVEPKGRVTGCEILQSAGPALDTATCRLLVERGRFEPARDASGQALASTYESQINWTVPEDAPVPFAPAARFAETWTPLMGGRPWCQLTTFGKLPLAVAHADCPPGSVKWPRPLGRRHIILRNATMLLPIGQTPLFRTKVRGRAFSRVRYQLAIDWRGVVVQCEPLQSAKKQRVSSTLPDDCALLKKQGQPVFQGAAPGTPMREAVMEYVSTSE
jgi:TonB family protein